VLVVGLGAVSSSRASGSSVDLALEVRPDGDASCRAVVGATGSERLCGRRGGDTVVGFHEQPRGLACPGGGRAVMWGADANHNRMLDPSELEGTTYVCRHARSARKGTRALVSTTPLRAHDGHCPAGGALVQSGIDRDGDGVLSDAEIDRATFACNRFGGAARRAFVDIADEPPGPACTAGGKRIGVGHEGEPARISFSCNAS
jgi:hypothetical protein